MMRHLRLFEELFDMQAEANRFFDDVYRRLTLFETALNQWSAIPDDTAFGNEIRRVARAGRSDDLPAVHTRVTVSNSMPVPAAAPVAMEMYDSPQELVAEIAMPGLEPGDLNISAHENLLTLEGRFTQTIKLPDGVDAEQVRAHYQDGVLRLALPRPAPASKSIPIDFD